MIPLLLTTKTFTADFSSETFMGHLRDILPGLTFWYNIGLYFTTRIFRCFSMFLFLKKFTCHSFIRFQSCFFSGTGKKTAFWFIHQNFSKNVQNRTFSRKKIRYFYSTHPYISRRLLQITQNWDYSKNVHSTWASKIWVILVSSNLKNAI